MTDDEIRAFMRVCEAATPGPWVTVPDPGCGATCECGDTCNREEHALLVRADNRTAGLAIVMANDRDAANARAIAAARTLAPALAAEVLRLREAVRSLEWCSGSATHCPECGGFQRDGHGSKCVIGDVLAATRGQR